MRPGLVIGHAPVGVVDELGGGVTGLRVGDRVLVGAITPCGQCRACLSGHLSQCGHGEGYEALGGWRFGNTINGSQAEYLLVPSAQANLARIPEGLSDEQVVLLADIASKGISGAESAGAQIGDTVVVFAQGPIGLCATAGAKLMGAALVIGVDGDDARLAMARRMGADVVLDHRQQDVVAEVKRITGGGADVAIEALGEQATFESALRSLRLGGTLSSLGVLLGEALAALRRVRGRPRRPPDHDDAVPRGQGADASSHGDGGSRAARPHPSHHSQVLPRRHRGGVRALRHEAGRGPQGRDHSVTPARARTRPATLDGEPSAPSVAGRWPLALAVLAYGLVGIAMGGGEEGGAAAIASLCLVLWLAV